MSTAGSDESTPSSSVSLSAAPASGGVPFLIAAPELSVEGAARALDFYSAAFGAVESERYHDGAGRVTHSTLRIGDAVLHVRDAVPDAAVASRSSTRLFVADTDESYARAIAAGATSTMQPTTMQWGDRMAQVDDPFGQRWTLTTHFKEDH